MTERLTLRQQHSLLGVSLAIPLLLLLAAGLLAHRASNEIRRTNEDFRRVDLLKAHAQEFLLAMIDNEAGQRGFILSQNPLFLEPYDHSLQVLPTLRQKVGENIEPPAAREPYHKLLASIDARLAFSAETVALQHAGQHDESVALVRTGRGKALMDQVRADVAALTGILGRETEIREARNASVVARNEVISWAIVALDLLFGGLFVFLLLRLQRQEQLLHVCAWSKTVEFEGEWITFEAYLERRFHLQVSHGISPAEADRILAQMRLAKIDRPGKTPLTPVSPPKLE